MEELSIEEKARAYDEAIEKLRSLHDDYDTVSTLIDIKEELENIFPELKESEDERIRKGLLYVIEHHPTLSTEEAEEYITWLEKQGHDGKKWIYEDVYIKEKEQLIQDGIEEVLTNPHKYGLEKQGEQKPAVEMKSAEESLNISSEEYNKIVDECLYSDNVEPKFHEDDWIIHHGTENIYQVVAVIDNQYQLKYGDNYTIQNCADVDRCARLWDITKDVKDGDVLSDGTTIFIFKDLLSDGSVMSYCDYDADSGESDAFCPLSVNLMCSKITPATKEQRDQLEKAMADAGYTFDFEKKVLKKIEQIIADNIPQDFEKYVEHLLSLSDGEGHGGPAKVKEVSAELFKLAKLEQKSAWSEEDEYTLGETIQHLEELIRIEKVKHCGIDVQYYQRDIDWLKSLKDRYVWKPSDEQMEALRIEEATVGTNHVVLASLISDLEKLI